VCSDQKGYVAVDGWCAVNLVKGQYGGMIGYKA